MSEWPSFWLASYMSSLFFIVFLEATSHLFKRVCPSVPLSICPFVVLNAFTQTHARNNLCLVYSLVTNCSAFCKYGIKFISYKPFFKIENNNKTITTTTTTTMTKATTAAAEAAAAVVAVG